MKRPDIAVLEKMSLLGSMSLPVHVWCLSWANQTRWRHSLKHWPTRFWSEEH